MKQIKKKKLIVTLGLLAFVVCAAAASAEEPMMPGMDEAMMTKMKEYSTPGENHEVLNYFIGDWDYTMKWWMAPQTPPQESSGTGEIESIMDGRFIEQTFMGTWMGEPFKGLGTMGYDNLKKQYVFTWIDNMSTGIMTSKGSYDSAAKTLTESGSHSCPISESGERSYKAVTQIIDDDTYTYSVYTTDPQSGQEFKSMEIMYTRKS
jgi:hypothetical protein